MSLYFIAVAPHRELREKARSFSKDFKDRFNSVKSYRNFPHITLIPPFTREEALEKDLIELFQNLKIETKSFTQKLNGFGSFPNPKNPVIFIKPENTEEIQALYKEVQAQTNFHPFKKPNPHLTVAYRDLLFENFEKAWAEYAEKEFKEEFLVDKICLFKHFNGKWNLLVMKNLDT